MIKGFKSFLKSEAGAELARMKEMKHLWGDVTATLKGNVFTLFNKGKKISHWGFYHDYERDSGRSFIQVDAVDGSEYAVRLEFVKYNYTPEEKKFAQLHHNYCTDHTELLFKAYAASPYDDGPREWTEWK